MGLGGLPYINTPAPANSHPSPRPPPWQTAEELRPGENGYAESFHSRLRDELLNAELFADLREARALADRWRNEYNHRRPHSSPGYVPPAPPAPHDQDSHKHWSIKRGQVSFTPRCRG